MSSKSLHIKYFAILREQRRTDSETVRTEAATPRELYADLLSEHGFTLGTDRLRVVINDEFRDWDAALADGDRVVFIPPVAGG